MFRKGVSYFPERVQARQVRAQAPRRGAELVLLGWLRATRVPEPSEVQAVAVLQGLWVPWERALEQQEDRVMARLRALQGQASQGPAG